MAVLEVGAEGRDKGFKEFGVFGDFLEEAQCCTADVFVWVLLQDTSGVENEHKRSTHEIIADGVAVRRCKYGVRRVRGENWEVTHTTRIISCFNLPFSSYFGHTSQ